MATLKLKNKPAASGEAKPGGERRSPLRGKGLSRPRPTLEQAQAERAERQASFEQRRAAEEQRDRHDGPGGSRPARPERSGGKSGYGTHGAQRGQGGGPAAKPAPRHSAAGGSFRREDMAGGSGAPARPRAPAPEAGAPPRRDQRRATGVRPPESQARPRPAPRPLADEGDGAEGERLSKRMTALGLASRREADEWIAAGWVRVDGELAVLGQRVGPDARIEVDPAARQEQAKQVTILLHKPIGYVSGQAEDGYEPASVLVKSATHWKDDPSGLKYHAGHARGLAPAGRLDIDSTGLLVLTQDGRVAKLLIGEESKVEKEYLVRVEYHGQASPMKDFPEQDLALLNHGLELDGVQLKPAKVSWINEDQLRFVLREGRKRQIRRMCELVGLKVVGLKRVRIGRINLGHLPAGQWRYLAPWERFD
ncbi:pseudouridine synthase [Kinneretia asaccharophila]|uniref:pseudouridine synthase n=1 Tax=Roseateles asaccharophilus TaxID=582607 RepID=UPI0025B3082A|nr:pseudouridine synthase [Roseateles asaccharophilus]MDN3544609.1 pseudouridine synthase [Roseateles asaccharophilus]